jgi:glycosyltransferase involved in cell wall biosynthesis
MSFRSVVRMTARRCREVRSLSLVSTPPFRWRAPLQGFSERDGVAFIGGFGHDPNLDAVHYLAEQIVPLVRKVDPSIRFRVIGRDAQHLQLPVQINLEVVGEVDDVNSVFDASRLTVAPLRFGAGLKSKVIESLAAGVPCIGTPIAYEGMTPPEAGRGCVADSPAEFADALLRLYREEQAYAECSNAGRLYAQNEYSEARVDDLIGKIVSPILRRRERAAQIQPAEPAEYLSTK